MRGNAFGGALYVQQYAQIEQCNFDNNFACGGIISSEGFSTEGYAYQTVMFVIICFFSSVFAESEGL